MPAFVSYVYSDRFVAIKARSEFSKLVGLEWRIMRFDPPISIRGSLATSHQWRKRRKPL